MRKRVLGYSQFSDRIILVKLKGKYFNIVIIADSAEHGG